MATYFHSLYATLKTFLILIFDKIFNTYTYDPTIIAGWVHAISMQSEDEQLHVYFSIWSCGLVSNSSALDNFLLIPFTELLFHYLSETYWLRDILVAYKSTVRLVRDGFMHSSEFWYFAKWTFKCFSFILD